MPSTEGAKLRCRVLSCSAVRNGCRQFIFYSTCASDFYVPEIEVWRASETWDYSHLDRFMAFFEAECPEARLIPQIYVGAPTWWEEQYPAGSTLPTVAGQG